MYIFIAEPKGGSRNRKTSKKVQVTTNKITRKITSNKQDQSEILQELNSKTEVKVTSILEMKTWWL